MEFKNLEKLYQESRSLDAEVAAAAKMESERQEKFRQERNKRWERMCDDILTLSKYSPLMDTGVPVYKDATVKVETLGFDVYEGNIRMISWLQKDREREYDPPKRTTCFFYISRNIPYKNSAPSSLTSFVDRLDILADNWEDILPVLEDDIAKRLEMDIKMKKQIIQEVGI
ncbi:MAG: hypothetical protein LUE14_12345 [Clostridiales bacterium]|nr:hypothetical protein [Clostridiales bacterium]